MLANRGGREAVIDVLIRNTPLEDRALYDRISWAYLDPDLAIDDADLRSTMSWFVERGLVPRPVDLDTAVDASFVQQTVGQFGAYR